MKKIITLLTSFALTIALSGPGVFALKDTTPNLGNNTSEYYDEFGNYYNPETGEFFKWGNSRGNVKDFTFKINIFVESASFELDTKKVKIYINTAKYVYGGGNEVPNQKGNFTVNLRRSAWPHSNNVAKFSAPQSSLQTYDLGSGFSLDTNYYIEITTTNSLDKGIYLEGSGYVYCY